MNKEQTLDIISRLAEAVRDLPDDIQILGVDSRYGTPHIQIYDYPSGEKFAAYIEKSGFSHHSEPDYFNGIWTGDERVYAETANGVILLSFHRVAWRAPE